MSVPRWAVFCAGLGLTTGVLSACSDDDPTTKAAPKWTITGVGQVPDTVVSRQDVMKPQTQSAELLNSFTVTDQPILVGSRNASDTAVGDAYLRIDDDSTRVFSPDSDKNRSIYTVASRDGVLAWKSTSGANPADAEWQVSVSKDGGAPTVVAASKDFAQENTVIQPLIDDARSIAVKDSTVYWTAARPGMDVYEAVLYSANVTAPHKVTEVVSNVLFPVADASGLTGVQVTDAETAVVSVSPDKKDVTSLWSIPTDGKLVNSYCRYGETHVVGLSDMTATNGTASGSDRLMVHSPDGDHAIDNLVAIGEVSCGDGFVAFTTNSSDAVEGTQYIVDTTTGEVWQLGDKTRPYVVAGTKVLAWSLPQQQGAEHPLQIGRWQR